MRQIPLTASVSAVPTRTTPSTHDGVLRSLLWVGPLLAATVLSKFSVPPFGAQGISIVLPVLLMLAGLGVIGNAFELAPQRFILAGVTLAVLGLMQLFKNDVFSLNSLVLLTALHLPFVLQFRQPLHDARRVTNFFTLGCGVIALLGILQFALQGRVPMQWIFPIDELVPAAFRVQNFNQQAPLEYGSEVLRANGVFMMEPSYLSQLLAVAVVLELATRHRLWLLTVLGAGMLVSYSGTGFIVLALAVPVLIISQRRWNVLLLALLGGAVLYVIVQNFSEQLYLDQFLSRSNEFSSTGSSGFARFVGGFYLFDQVLWSQPLRVLFGTGAGSFKDFAAVAHYPVAEMPLFKMVLEFGLVGAFAYFFFLVSCLSTRGVPAAVALAVGLTFLLNGLYVPFSHALSLSLLLWTRPAEATHRLETSTPAAPVQSRAAGMPVASM